MHTPRLCIDARVGKRNYCGLVAEEVINQLVASQGQSPESNEWVERGRAVLLARPDQVFGGQWRRYNTKMPVGISPIYWAWERNFVKEASLSVFHKFRPADRLGLELPCETVTTVLPAGRIPKPIQWMSKKQRFIVPSQKDRTELMRTHTIPGQNITVIAPAIRRYCLFCDAPALKSEGWILIIHDHANSYQHRLLKILRDRFPSLPMHAVSTRNTAEFEPSRWIKTLEQTQFALYLADRSYDWAFAPLELLYWGIAVVFPDEHGPLSELLPNSPLRLSSFLVNQPTLESLRCQASTAAELLDKVGVFDPLAYARQFGAVYSTVPDTTH